MLLFGVFLITGSFAVFHLSLSGAQVLLWDGLLSAVFFLQHSGMVRSSFRAWLSPVVPAHYYPATYAIASGVVLTLVVLLWQRAPTTIYEIAGLWRLPFYAAFVLAIAGFAWGVRALGAFDPLGRRAILTHVEDKQTGSELIVRGPYLWVRHPLYSFVAVLIWATPSMSMDRLLFNVLWTSWIVVGACLEERDLAAEFGVRYRHYQEKVPMLIPWRGRPCADL